jgi:hypothetical protein
MNRPPKEQSRARLVWSWILDLAPFVAIIVLAGYGAWKASCRGG